MGLSEAVINNDKARVKLLLKAGADPNIQNDYGNALHYSDSPEITQILLQAGADPNIQDYAGNTPLHYSESSEHTQLLLKAGANPNIKNMNGSIPLQNTKHNILLNFNSQTDFYTTKISIFKLN